MRTGSPKADQGARPGMMEPVPGMAPPWVRTEPAKNRKAAR